MHINQIWTNQFLHEMYKIVQHIGNFSCLKIILLKINIQFLIGQILHFFLLLIWFPIRQPETEMRPPVSIFSFVTYLWTIHLLYMVNYPKYIALTYFLDMFFYSLIVWWILWSGLVSICNSPVQTSGVWPLRWPKPPRECTLMQTPLTRYVHLAGCWLQLGLCEVLDTPA